MKVFSAKQREDTIFCISSLIKRKLSEDLRESLEHYFSKEELFRALNGINSNKCPGPDGINATYIKEFWYIISDDVCEMAEVFNKNFIFPLGLNSSFISLIPKKDCPSLVTNYRPISLIICTLKIILKLLAERLSRVLKFIVSEEQFGFVKGRTISKSVVIVKEIVHSMHRREVEGLILKIDFEKAFDSVKWSFLFEVLQEFGFGKKWKSWLEAIFKSARLSVLINGSPSKEFSIGRGLRQGDPLSPLLFILVGEVLHLLLEKSYVVSVDFRGCYG